ncbi:ENR1 protein, partial [Urocynchramus pylzowi]|nr:ENR1 protein [Urocynchramus pylzowi]
KGSGANPYQSLGELRGYWSEPGNTKTKWKTPDDIYWICGKKAYNKLPQKWKGSYTFGLIRPVFFTLPRSESHSLRIPPY